MAWLRYYPEKIVQNRAGRAILCVGNFDGVHAGHRALLSKAHEIAKEHGGAPVVVLTFLPHPRMVLRPDLPFKQLMSLEEKCLALGEAGADGVAVLPFTPEVAGWSPERFVAEILRGWLDAGAVVVGENFRFGAGAAGSAATLEDAGLSVFVLDLVRDASGRVISSSALRHAAPAEEPV